ncbi:hypothetical protein [Rheinheimera sp.]|uniref:hypothetical protein n=1 Tax=Rheinheimera sp. TaxID=1869214 RepID=UPI0037C4F2C8
MPVFKFAVLLVVVAYSQVNLMSLLDTVTLAFWLTLNILFLTGSASVKDTLSNFFSGGYFSASAISQKQLVLALSVSAAMLTSLMLITNLTIMQQATTPAGLALCLLPVFYSAVYLFIRK